MLKRLPTLSLLKPAYFKTVWLCRVYIYISPTLFWSI